MVKKISTGEWFSLAYILLMTVTTVQYILDFNEFRLSVAVAGVACGIAPFIGQKLWKTKFENGILIWYILFLFGSQYLGSINKWYSLGWWDMFMHMIAGLLLGVIGIRVFEKFVEPEIRYRLKPKFVFWFVKGFGVFWGVMWEVYEFACDTFLGMTLQGKGNPDTMTDLICDLLGSYIIAKWYMKKHRECQKDARKQEIVEKRAA